MYRDSDDFDADFADLKMLRKAAMDDDFMVSLPITVHHVGCGGRVFCNVNQIDPPLTAYYCGECSGVWRQHEISSMLPSAFNAIFRTRYSEPIDPQNPPMRLALKQAGRNAYTSLVQATPLEVREARLRILQDLRRRKA